MRMARFRCQGQKQKGSGPCHMPGPLMTHLHSWKQAEPPALPQQSQIQHALSTPNSLSSPHLITDTRPWPDAILCPWRDGPTAPDLGCKSNSHCQQLQVLGLGSSTKGIPSSHLLALPRMSTPLNPFRMGPFLWASDTLNGTPKGPAVLKQHPCTKWADLPKSWAHHPPSTDAPEHLAETCNPKTQW